MFYDMTSNLRHILAYPFCLIFFVRGECRSVSRRLQIILCSTGGFPEKELKEVVKELHSALEANFNTQVDVALIQQIITLMKELPAVKPKATAAKRKSLQKKRQRVVNDDDEDVDGDHEADVEEEEDDENEEGEEDDIEEDLLDIVANEEDIEASQAQVEILQPDYIQKKREESAVTLQPERLMITRTIEKALDKIKTKRGEIMQY